MQPSVTRMRAGSLVPVDIETRYALNTARATGSWRLWFACVLWIAGLRRLAAWLLR
jgi:hypothetical protein